MEQLSTPKYEEPPWGHVNAMTLRDSNERHDWMCGQLQLRRRYQMNLGEPGSWGGNGKRAIAWYEEQLSKLFPGSRANEVVEVLSDGIGFVEPNWSAISTSPEDASGVVKIGREALADKKLSVRRARALMAQSQISDDPYIVTQRAIGQYLYEPGLFLVTANAVYFCPASDSGRSAHDHSRDSAWLEVVDRQHGSPLPLKVPKGSLSFVQETNRKIDSSLRELTTKVLWKGLLPSETPEVQCFSLVLIYTSLWQETAGVWAMHVACTDSLGTPNFNVPLSGLRALVEPAALCLEDVLGWSCEFEGTHRWKRFNVDFLDEMLGKRRRRWTLDGLSSGPGGADSAIGENEAQEIDKIAYDLSVDRLPSESIRDVFRQAVDQFMLDRGEAGERPAFVSLSPEAQAVVRSMDGAAVGVRLDDMVRQLFAETGAQPASKGVSDLPCTSSLYLSAVERSLDLKDGGGGVAIVRAEAIEDRLQCRIQSLTRAAERAYCELVVECFRNYLDQLRDRLRLAHRDDAQPGDARSATDAVN